MILWSLGELGINVVCGELGEVSELGLKETNIDCRLYSEDNWYDQAK